MTGYTRQSTFGSGDTIEADDHNNEYNQLSDAFDSQTGHAHDGSSAEGPVIGLIGDSGDETPTNKIVVDTGNNQVGFWADDAGVTVEQFRYEDGALYPVTDNDIDLGKSSLQFKDIYATGTGNIDSLALSSGVTVSSILDEDDLSSDSNTALATQQSIKAYLDNNESNLDHDSLSGFVVNEHVDHSTVSISTGTGLSGGGDITASRTISLNANISDLNDAGGKTGIDSNLVSGTSGTSGNFLQWNSDGDATDSGNSSSDFASSGHTHTTSDLSDYEEGSWTPNLFPTNDVTFASLSTAAGRYVKIGKLVFIQARVAASSLNGANDADGAMAIGSLPFSSNGRSPISVDGIGGLSLPDDVSVLGVIPDGESYCVLRLWSQTTSTSPLNASEFSDDGEVVISGTYEAQ